MPPARRATTKRRPQRRRTQQLVLRRDVDLKPTLTMQRLQRGVNYGLDFLGELVGDPQVQKATIISVLQYAVRRGIMRRKGEQFTIIDTQSSSEQSEEDIVPKPESNASSGDVLSTSTDTFGSGHDILQTSHPEKQPHRRHHHHHHSSHRQPRRGGSQRRSHMDTEDGSGGSALQASLVHSRSDGHDGNARLVGATLHDAGGTSGERGDPRSQGSESAMDMLDESTAINGVKVENEGGSTGSKVKRGPLSVRDKFKSSAGSNMRGRGASASRRNADPIAEARDIKPQTQRLRSRTPAGEDRT